MTKETICNHSNYQTHVVTTKNASNCCCCCCSKFVILTKSFNICINFCLLSLSLSLFTSRNIITSTFRPFAFNSQLRGHPLFSCAPRWVRHPLTGTRNGGDDFLLVAVYCMPFWSYVRAV